MRVGAFLTVLLVALALVSNAKATLTQEAVEPTPYMEFDSTGVLNGVDPLAEVRSVIGFPEHDPTYGRSVEPVLESSEVLDAQDEDVAFVETEASVSKHQSFCEVCILMMQLRQNNKPQICKGLAPEHWLTCVGILESLLRADKALVYWEKNGCLHMDASGPQIVKPCPALPICSWVPNLFGAPPSIVRDGIEPICPKDNKYMPVIPPNFQPVSAETLPEMPTN